MIDKIRTAKQFDQVMNLIENYLQKATEGGGFSSLSKKAAGELQRLSLLAEAYEDTVLKIMPLPVTINSIVQQKITALDITQQKLADMFRYGYSKTFANTER